MGEHIQYNPELIRLGNTIDGIIKPELSLLREYPYLRDVGNGTLYLGVTYFGPNTEENIKDEWEKYKKRLAKGALLSARQPQGGIGIIVSAWDQELQGNMWECIVEGIQPNFKLRFSDGRYGISSTYQQVPSDFQVTDTMLGDCEKAFSKEPLVRPNRLMTDDEYDEWLRIAESLPRKKVYRVQEARGYQEYRSFVNQYGQIGIERRPKFGLGGDAVETQMPMMVGFRDLSAGATICKVTTYVHNPGEKPIEPVINFEHGLGEIQRVAKGEQTSLQ